MSDDISIFQMPPIPREPFKSDEDYERAVRTSKEASIHSPEDNGDIFIPEDKLVSSFIALINGAHAVGLGVLHDADMTTLEAVEMLSPLLDGVVDIMSFDYINGRPIKIKPLKRVPGGYQFNPRLYNRDSYRTAENILGGL